MIFFFFSFLLLGLRRSIPPCLGPENATRYISVAGYCIGLVFFEFPDTRECLFYCETMSVYCGHFCWLLLRSKIAIFSIRPLDEVAYSHRISLHRCSSGENADYHDEILWMVLPLGITRSPTGEARPQHISPL